MPLSRRILLSVLGISSCVLMLTADAPAAPPSPATGAAETSSVEPSLEVLSPAVLPPVVVRGNRSDKIYLTLRQLHSEGEVRIFHSLSDRQGRRSPHQIEPRSIFVKKDAITEVCFTFNGPADPSQSYSGKLLLQANGSRAFSEVPVELLPEKSYQFSDVVLVLSLVMSVLSVGVAALVLASRGQINSQIADPKWEFSSWATNLTVATTVLSGLLIFLAPADPRAGAPQNDYKLLLAFFALPVAMAPVVFYVLPHIRRSDASGTGGDFAVAGFFTMAGAQAQMLLLGFLLRDLYATNLIGPLMLSMMCALTVMTSIGLALYSNVTIMNSVKNDSQKLL